jgi:hypothetical protein
MKTALQDCHVMSIRKKINRKIWLAKKMAGNVGIVKIIMTINIEEEKEEVIIEVTIIIQIIEEEGILEEIFRAVARTDDIIIIIVVMIVIVIGMQIITHQKALLIKEVSI